MSNFELEIQNLKEKIAILEKKKNQIPTYSFSNIKFSDLKSLVEIERELNSKDIFVNWLENRIKLNFYFNGRYEKRT